MAYFDHSATTPIDRRVVEKMAPYFANKYGNPSSNHSSGQQAKKAVEKARSFLANFLNCQPEEIIFTSGGTEANNLAIRGVVKSFGQEKPTPHLITSQIEHHSILNTIKELEKDKKIRVTYLKPERTGQIKAEQLKKAIKPETLLVSIMYANNETGAIQPIRQIGKLIEKINKKRKSKIFFHTDAVQAIEYLNCNVKYLHVHLLSLSAHKFYGPKGVGALYSAKDIPLSPIITGGHQEKDKRAGTENVAGIVGLGEAIRLVKKEGKKDREKIKETRNYFENQLKSKISDIKINSAKANRLPGSSNVSFEKAEGESTLLALDMKGFAVSTGSACASKELKPSHTLIAMDIPPEKAQGTIRFSFGKNNNKKEIDQLMEELSLIIKKLRKMSPK